MSSVHFVYTLLRLDTWTTFYVGMGKGARISQHSRSTMDDCSGSTEYRRLRACGVEVRGVKIATGLTRDQAYDLERLMIQAIGRGKDGALVNKTAGGGGTPGCTPKPEHRAARSLAMKRRYEDPAARERARQAQINRPDYSEAVAKLKANHALFLATPDAKQRCSDAMRAFYVQNPEAKKLRSESAIKRWADPVEREKASVKSSEGTRKRLQDPAAFERHMAGQRRRRERERMLREGTP